MHPFLADLDEHIATHGLLPPGGSCLVAVSGGVDSMVLLESLARLAPGRSWRLVVAHFNHRWRGADSDADEEFVATAAQRLGLAVVTERAADRDRAAPGDSPEAAARRLRHEFLARAARDHGCDRIALAHHADDQTELFLMRLLRGAGGAGLCGMSRCGCSPVDADLRLIRPLLEVPKARLEQVARECGWDARSDATNLDLSFLRNRVRHELIPRLRERFQPALDRVLAREQTILRDQALLVEDLASAWLAGPGTDPCAFAELAVAVQRDALRLQLERLGIAPGFDLIESLRSEAGTPIQIDATRRVVREPDGKLRSQPGASDPTAFRMDEQEVALSEAQGRGEFGNVEYVWRCLDGGGPPPDPEENREILDADTLGERVRLRHWRPGDRLRPIGLGASAKLQDLFTNARVPAAERRGRVLLEAVDGEIVWVEGLRIAERAKVGDATRRRLEWRWRRRA